MAIVESTVTQFLKIPVPGENSVPFFEAFLAYTDKIEDAAFYNKMFVNFMLAGGGTIVWNAGTSLFQWNANFVIPVFQWGRKIEIEFGPDGATQNANVPDGSFLYVEVPKSMRTNQVLNFKVKAQLDVNRNDEFIVGWNNGGVLQLRDLGEFT